ncbi:MAG: hypothetical protein WDZ56_00295 [Candidatus Paceibacterota bacterium]
MKIIRNFFTILNIGLLVFVAIFIILFTGWIILNTDVNTEDAKKHAEMVRLQASAKNYYSRLQFYDGICSDIGIPVGWRCHSFEAAYAIEIGLKEGGFLCLDSSGYLGQSLQSKHTNTHCPGG